jgi:hypothetical protein
MNSPSERLEPPQPTLAAALACLQNRQSQPPPSKELVATLLAIEKQNKRDKQRFTYAQLLGTWRLGFITGTVKARQQAGVALGAGRFLPRFLQIQISYEATDLEAGRGTVKNSVLLGGLTLQLSGPTQYWPKTNSLAFDFTQMTISLGGLTLYSGGVRGGDKRDAEFYQQTLKDQAFFTYFEVHEAYLAARGRGGGLALWTRG